MPFIVQINGINIPQSCATITTIYFPNFLPPYINWFLNTSLKSMERMTLLSSTPGCNAPMNLNVPKMFFIPTFTKTHVSPNSSYL